MWEVTRRTAATRSALSRRSPSLANEALSWPWSRPLAGAPCGDSVGEDGGWGSWAEQLQYMVCGGGGGGEGPSSFITTQKESDESGGFLLVLYVTPTPDGDLVRPEPGRDGEGSTVPGRTAS